MASTSHHGNSSYSSRWSIDVFLSFRGEDTRKTVVDYLHMMLEQAGINVFIDDVGLRKGEDISSDLMKAIQASKISIVVFSKNYAGSTWCLEELSRIMLCRRTLQQMVIPIFFDIEPPDVRRQKGTFADAFEKHERRLSSLGNDINKIQRWKDDLFEAANLSGWDLRNTADGHQAKFIKKIVEQVSRELNSCLFVTHYPVGIQARLKYLCDMLCVRHNDVYMLGILGMGGVGKTTIAKAIYNQLNYSFEGKSFLMNVREKSLVSLQEQLLFDILKIEVKIDCEDRGINLIRQRLCNKRVFVIVDDADQSRQLNSLVGSSEWFGPGSRILITTRDERLLNVHGVNSIHRAQEMDDSESLELFSWHAFRNSSPREDYHELSKCMVNYCSGLPLALEVLGCSLYHRSIIEWRSMLDKLEKIPPNEVHEKLRISYDTLDDEEVKNIFLDICCFFIGMHKNYVVKILDGCGFSTEIAVNLLLERCLLTINNQNKFVVHNLLREMAARVIREKFPEEPGKWSRLWQHEDVLDVLTKHTGSEEIRGLTLRIEKGDEASFHTGTFSKMQRLRLLQLDYVQLNGSYGHISKELRWLCWHGFPRKIIPSSFNLEYVVAIDLQYSNLRQVWKNAKSLEKLKILNISHSHYLIQTPDFSKVPNLNELVLEGCKSLSEVHHSIGKLHKLVLVNLKDCKTLKKLPRSFYNLKSVEIIILSGCSTFHDLDKGIGKMKSLTTLLADNTRIKSLPSTMQQLSKLQKLYLGCGELSTTKSRPSLFQSWVVGRQVSKPIPSLLVSLQGLNCLQELQLTSCKLTDDDVIHTGVWSLPSLHTLDLSGNNFHSIASSLSGLSRLHHLTLDNCKELQSIPNLPRELLTLSATNCVALEALPNLSDNKYLIKLTLQGCDKLVEMPDLDMFLMSTHAVIDIQGCYNITASFSESTLQGLSFINRVLFHLSGDDIPGWFPYFNQGSGVSFEVPMGFHVKGLVVCIVYVASKGYRFKTDEGGLCVVNYTKKKRHIITPNQLGLDNLMMARSGLLQFHILCPEFNIRGGDKVTVVSFFGENFICKKIGVCLVWYKPINSNLIQHVTMANDDAIWQRHHKAMSKFEINFPWGSRRSNHLASLVVRSERLKGLCSNLNV